MTSVKVRINQIDKNDGHRSVTDDRGNTNPVRCDLYTAHGSVIPSGNVSHGELRITFDDDPIAGGLSAGEEYDLTIGDSTGPSAAPAADPNAKPPGPAPASKPDPNAPAVPAPTGKPAAKPAAP